MDWLGGEVHSAHLNLTEGRMTPPPCSGFLLTLSLVLGNSHHSVTFSISYKLGDTAGTLFHNLLTSAWFHFSSSLIFS